ncbi:hypothetical protein [Rhodoferax sp. GW822-FHT02A01]|uniref:hypothetical protein n=1 Tax=Rhodoferax sp. GW822-FHT02A01 TaxID=3141537 RepID=UPI00315D8616
MTTPTQTEGYYAGLSGLEFLSDWQPLELGEGLLIQRTYGHFMQSNIMAFKLPANPGEHHAGPWKATTQHDGWDVHAELFIPSSYKPKHGASLRDVAGTLVAMIRLKCDPNVRFLVESNYSLSAGADLGDQMRIKPIETMPQYTRLGFVNPEDAKMASHRLVWVRDNWKHAVSLMGSHADFKTAIDTFAMSMFIPNHGTTLVALWGALEALFSPSTSELRFRVSILLASYLHPPGEDRAKIQKEIYDLYDKRSAAAHGKPKHSFDHLVQTFNIMQVVLVRMIEENSVPTKAHLNDLLLGGVKP